MLILLRSLWLCVIPAPIMAPRDYVPKTLIEWKTTEVKEKEDNERGVVALLFQITNGFRRGSWLG